MIRIDKTNAQLYLDRVVFKFDDIGITRCKLVGTADDLIDTTAGLFEYVWFSENDHAEEYIEYDSAHAGYLPFEWPKLLWVDDADVCQHIKSIDFEWLARFNAGQTDELKPAYIMENGHVSQGVILYG